MRLTSEISLELRTNDVGLPGRSSSATVLSLVPGGLAQDEDQVPPLGRDPQPFSHAGV